MIKRVLMVSLVVALCLTVPSWAGKTQKEDSVTQEPAFTGRTEYQSIRLFLDFVVDVMAGLELKYNDARVSPIVRAETWYEFPVELGWLGAQDTLVPLLEKLLNYSFADSKVAHGSITISCTAETLQDGQPLLVFTGQERLLCFDGAGKAGSGQPGDLWNVVSKRNQQITRAIRDLLKITTFTPQIRKKIQGGGVSGPGQTWITNLRIDNNNRLQLTGYALDPKQATQFGEELLKSGSFTELFFANMNKNTYEKVPVWRFDLSAMVN